MVNKVIKEVICYCLIASIYIAAPLGGASFTLFWYTPLYLIFLVYAVFVYRRINVKVLYALLGLAAFSLLTYKSDLSLVIKQLINISVYTLVFYYLIAQEKYSVEDFFQKYVRFSKVILIIGFFQVFAFSAGLGEYFLYIFPFLSDTNISSRFQSLSEEPSFIGLTFAPIVFCAFHNILNGTRYFMGKIWSFLFILGMLLTLASTCYFTLFMILILLYFKYLPIRKLALFFAFIFSVGVFAYLSYYFIPYIRDRIDDTLYAMTKDFEDPRIYKDVNLSTYAFLSNAMVTKKSLAENTLFGRGLGTHQSSYATYVPRHMKEYSILNEKDANSMLLRLFSETGIIGFLFFMWFVFQYRIKANRLYSVQNEILWIINAGIFAAILTMLIRHGNYTSSGKILYFLLYYYSYRYVENSLAEETSSDSVLPVPAPVN